MVKIPAGYPTVAPTKRRHDSRDDSTTLLIWRQKTAQAAHLITLNRWRLWSPILTHSCQYTIKKSHELSNEEKN